jgi:hypothetical protein
MLNINQINNLKFIYQLFANIKNYAIIWSNEIKENDETENHIDKLNMILNSIKETECQINDLDSYAYTPNGYDLIIVVEELLKEHIMEKYYEKKGNEYDSDSDVQ